MLKTAFQSPSLRNSIDGVSQSIHTQNIYTAVKQLKQHDEKLINLANRINILQRKEQSNLKRCEKNQMRLQSLQHVKSQHRQKIQNLSIHRQKVLQKVNQQHHINQKQRNEIKNRLTSVYFKIEHERTSNYSQMKQRRIQNENKIHKLKQLNQNEKRKMRQTIWNKQIQLKQSIVKKLNDKKQNINIHKSIDIQLFRQKSRRNQQKIQNLARLQSQLLDRTSQSQIRQKQSRTLFLQKILPKKLPSNNFQTNSSNQVHPLVKRIDKRMHKYKIDHGIR